ncbi:uncharacterized protein LOC113357457 isoform X1 [Papaver somniferum]|uniref:uncharacterized protein LOC113357457 isoform X1 n=1 Tax=Papaver somniferum TaxID=3469 RepID=UPI000E702DDE|nr:uncharacterized protein LOC113357457 isoform X1 [Papaver somniferum]XP_026456637.1 uncharacterized protein LOC113357457 isoform X1 [Papaver somniferum]XP_026456638.1 uncharacterized protein LOC113357457 isoform X1 [Papaver somniferum]XP_026456639.1 uncharacterized protein LOC113357457 isoform X1 [Papaver somniferum]XP_026456640.1 uncharacterized protein LOC113357457 isoform X1 [Papaver somniferum]XP_026456641.1 uncharacterized protein LOC113357457 isoform X1 [Papaver somniferum]
MENLYSKLYDKYNKLKTRKDSEIDRYNHDQEVKFTGYMAAVEELVNCLRSENDRLVTKNQDLRNELASVRADRSDKEELCVQYEKLLTEETRKGKELSEEVEKLRNLQQEGLSCSARGRYNENGQMESPRGTYVESIHLSSVNNRKRLSTNEDTDSDSRGKLPVAIETERDSQSIQKESCCGKIISSGGSINANCVFHTLLEFLIGMKFEFVTKADGPCLSALHQSSGFSFTLTWLTKASENEPLELLYHVLSLGTFERIAPEWMREDLIFSSSMCPVFFKRVSSVIGLHL